MRAMLELGGVRDVVGKSLGSRNPINIVKATLEALSLLRDPVTERVARLGLATPIHQRRHGGISRCGTCQRAGGRRAGSGSNPRTAGRGGSNPRRGRSTRTPGSAG